MNTTTMETQQAWISVHERLPEHQQKVLFCYADGENESAWYRYPTTMRIGDFYRESPTKATFRHDCRPVNNENVAYWMPNPPPASVCGHRNMSEPKPTESETTAAVVLLRMIGQHVIHCKRTELTQDKTTVENRDVILMAVCGNYSMVRRPGCIPYVCDTRDLIS